MKCPRCIQKIHRAATTCPHCGFSVVDADEQFGSENIRLRCLTDSAGILRHGDRERVEAVMRKISLRVPQIFVAVFTGALGEIANMRQFGFWLLNRGVFEDVPVKKSNEAGILFTLDPESKSTGMFFGYLLEPFLSEADTFECLSRAHASWLDEQYAEGIIKALVELEDILCKRSRQARRNPEHFRRKVMPPTRLGAAQKISANHPVQTSNETAVIREEEQP